MTDAMTDPVLALAVPFIAEREGFRSHPYQDQGGTWTIGYGFTVMEDGRHVTADTPPIDQDAAYARLTRMVAGVAAKVLEMVHHPLTVGQHAALTSFAYNCGTGALRSSMLLKLLETGDVQAAADQFRAWVYAGGQVSNGLVARREAERAMFLSQDAAPIVKADPQDNVADDLNAAELSRIKQ